MLTTELFIAIISLCITVLILVIPLVLRAMTKHKNNRPMSCQTKRLFFTNYLQG